MGELQTWRRRNCGHRFLFNTVVAVVGWEIEEAGSDRNDRPGAETITLDRRGLLAMVVGQRCMQTGFITRSAGGCSFLVVCLTRSPSVAFCWWSFSSCGVVCCFFYLCLVCAAGLVDWRKSQLGSSSAMALLLSCCIVAGWSVATINIIIDEAASGIVVIQ